MVLSTVRTMSALAKIQKPYTNFRVIESIKPPATSVDGGFVQCSLRCSASFLACVPNDAAKARSCASRAADRCIGYEEGVLFTDLSAPAGGAVFLLGGGIWTP